MARPLPSGFYFQGKYFELPPMPYQILNFLWGKKSVLEGELL